MRLGGSGAGAQEPLAREEHPVGAREPQMYSPTQPPTTDDLPPGYAAPPPASYAPAPEYLHSQNAPHQPYPPATSELPSSLHDMSAAELAASLASSENPEDLLQAFSSLTQEGLATLGNFAAFQDPGAKRQKTEGVLQPGQHYHMPGVQVAGNVGGVPYQGSAPGWHQPQDVHNYRTQHYQHQH
jgi:hypothetical protein